MLTRRVSIAAGAHRKKSHADESSLFQWLSTAVRRSNFNPPNAAGRKRTHGKCELVVTRETGPREAKAPQRIRLEAFVTISTGVCARGNVKRQRQRFGFRGAGAKQNCRAIGAGPRITASSSISFVLVSKHVGGRAPRKIQPRVGRRVQSETTCFRRRSPPPNPRNPAQCRRSMRRLWRNVVRARARS